MPEAEEMLTIDGALDLASSGMAYLQPRKTPSALTAITLRHSAEAGLLHVTRCANAGIVDETIEAAMTAPDLGHRCQPVFLARSRRGRCRGCRA